MTALTQELARELYREQGVDIVIPDTYTSIEEEAFYGLFDVQSVVIPNSVVSIGESAFESCSLTSLEIPDSVTTIEKSAFEDNQLESVSMGDGVSSIGEKAFRGNELTNVDFGNGLTTIGDKAFANNNLESIALPESLLSIGDNAFQANQLTDNLLIPDSVVFIGANAFAGNEITSFYLPSSAIGLSDEWDGGAGSSLEVIYVSETNPRTSISQNYDVIIVPDDLDDDGFVDVELTDVNVSTYQMWTYSGGVDLQTFQGLTFSDQSSPRWNATQAVEVESEFDVLLEGAGRRDGLYRVISANESGIITGITTWSTADQLTSNGYEEIFNTDFNGNGTIDFV